MFRKAYTFDDVALVPQYNNIQSRTIPSLETWLTKNIKIDIPIVPSNMDTVIGDEMASVFVDNKSMPIFHRFDLFENQEKLIKKYGKKCFFSCGLNDVENTIKLYDIGCAGICIDIAHGHCSRMLDFIKTLKYQRPNIEIIAGNVCTPMAYQDLVNAGADSVKVGVGPGSACTTRVITGFGVPQFSAIYDCAEIAKKLRIPIIADGGIRGSRDILLALGAGASSVMIGGLFSKTFDSPCPKFVYDTESKKIVREIKYYPEISLQPNQRIIGKYRGQASSDFQLDFYGEVKKGTVPEGISFYQYIDKSAQQVIDDLCGGIRSGLTYGGANNIKEFQRKAEFCIVSPESYNKESYPRPEIIL